MDATVPRRRERLRAETTAEIKSIALGYLATGGAEAVSLRAIARRMGMSAGAIYSYFDTRDALVTELVADVHTALADVLEAAHRAVPDGDVAGRVVEHGVAYRDWAVAHPSEFQLVYGNPIPGYHQPEGGAAAEATLRVCALLVDLVEAVWPRAAATQDRGDYAWEDFPYAFARAMRSDHPNLPPAAMALALRIWGRMHGLVVLEIYGQLRPQVVDPARLYLEDMHDLARSLGLDPAPARR